MPPRAGWVAVIAGIVSLAAYGSGSAQSPGPIRTATTGNHSELLETVPVRSPRNRIANVVMTLGPQRLGPLGSATRIEPSAELEVSVPCARRGRKCVGRPYRYSPRIEARMVIAKSASVAVTKGGLTIGEPEALRCSQRPPNRNHHCVLVLEGSHRIDDPEALPCRPSACRLSLVVRAMSKRARRGHKVVIGSDSQGRRIAGDKGRLNVAVIPAGAEQPTTVRTTGLLTRNVGVVGTSLHPRDRVVRSIRLDDLTKGEQLVVRGQYVADIRDLDSTVFISSELVLSERPRSASRFGEPERIADLNGQIAEGNGFNCTQGPSAFQTPCAVRKVGLVRILRDAQQPLFLNLVSGMKAIGEGHRRGDRARILPRGQLVVQRYQGG